MNGDSGWRPLRSSLVRRGAQAFEPTPFGRLARTHALAISGDTLVATALAGSLFFSIDPSDARWRVGLYLVLTMAPFAVVAPLIGPAIDRSRGGRRWMITVSCALRALVCLLLISHVDSLLLFPEAFALLVLSKGYTVAKSALVPTTVRNDAELVEANSKLSLIGGLSSFVAAVPGIIALKLGGPEWVVGLNVVVFGAATIAAFRLPSTKVALQPPDAIERAELRSAGIRLAASAMALLRGIVGFLTFLLAFDLRAGDAPSWHFGVVLAVSVAASLVGAAVAPALRRSVPEERILISVLTLTLVSGLVTAYSGGLASAVGLAATVALAASAGKLAFDSIVQRDAPDANRGRSFARFETRFQLVWVIGAVPPVVARIPDRLGFGMVAGVAGFAAFSYWAGLRAARHGASSPSGAPAGAAAEQTATEPAAIAAPAPTTSPLPAAASGSDPTRRHERPPPRRWRR